MTLFVLVNAPSASQWMLNIELEGIQYAQAYLENVSINLKTRKEHLDYLKRGFR